jgi:hypothetical protein
MTALRYIDLVLLWLTVPLLLVLGAPQLGVLLAAGVWTVQRAIAIAVDRKAATRQTVREALGLNMATMFARVWLMASVILVAGIGGSREDGAAAAAVLLVAFTVSFVATLFVRALSRVGGSSPGSASHA